MAEERRRFFRINDDVGISWRKLGTEEAKAFARQTREQSGQFDLASNFDNRIQTLIDACKIQTPLAAELIDLLNKKMNFIIQQMDVDSELIHRIAFTQQVVNISACGIAFPCDSALKKNDYVQLDLQLLPSQLQLVVLAKVVDCNKLPEDQMVDGQTHFLRLNFDEIGSNDQEMLIQHIVKRQSSQLKQQRTAQ